MKVSEGCAALRDILDVSGKGNGREKPVCGVLYQKPPEAVLWKALKAFPPRRYKLRTAELKVCLHD